MSVIKTLKDGDYVTNLTAREFNELIQIEANPLELVFFDRMDVCKTLVYTKGILMFTGIESSSIKIKRRFTFEKFKALALSTYK
jgi:hypothetical protein